MAAWWMPVSFPSFSFGMPVRYSFWSTFWNGVGRTWRRTCARLLCGCLIGTPSAAAAWQFCPQFDNSQSSSTALGWTQRSRPWKSCQDPTALVLTTVPSLTAKGFLRPLHPGSARQFACSQLSSLPDFLRGRLASISSGRRPRHSDQRLAGSCRGPTPCERCPCSMQRAFFDSLTIAFIKLCGLIY